MEEVVEDIKLLSDEELIKAILQAGNMDLFGELYDRYGNKVYRKVISMVKDMETAKDLTQEILVKAFLSLAKFEGKSKFSTWLFMVTYNYCIDYLRKKKRSFDYNNELTEGAIEQDDDDGVYEKQMLEMEFERLDELLELIPVEEKTMLLMYYQDDMSVKDLQEHFNLGASAVKMRLSRIRAKLKKMYEETYKS